MRIHIEQKVKEDDHGLAVDHIDYDQYREGVVKAWQVVTTAICLETGKKSEAALFGIACPEDDTSYIKEIKAEQIREVLGELGFEWE